MYEEVIKLVKDSGKRLLSKAGTIDDIGVAKQYLTEEDLRIERDIKALVESFGSDHRLYAEEENDRWPDARNIWVADPISGTSTFINGLPHYGIVVSHIQDRQTRFSAVYDPSMDEMYTAEAGKGAALNGRKMDVSTNSGDKLRVLLHITRDWMDRDKIVKVLTELSRFGLYRTPNSWGVDYGLVAAGKYDGFLAVTKDIFPEVAGSLLIREAGGKFTTLDGISEVAPHDSVFVGGNPAAYETLLPLARTIFSS